MREIVRGVRAYERKTDKIILIDVDVEIDLQRVGRALGSKAFNNVSGKSVMMGGAIVVYRRGTKVKEGTRPEPAEGATP